VFPPTYAAGEGEKKGGYNIDRFQDGSSICLIDSVGSQANRMELRFIEPPLSELIPSVLIQAGKDTVNLLEAGHRAGDALLRCTPLLPQVEKAFLEYERGNAVPMAKFSPMSLVFGCWDSRNTYVKMPRIVESTIRAYKVNVLTRSATYSPPIDYIGEGLAEEPDKKLQEKYSQIGLLHVPSTGTHGGIVAQGGIWKTSTISFPALRLARAPDAKQQERLQKYLLGLALVAVTVNRDSYLRQGCHLVLNPDAERKSLVVRINGSREEFSVEYDEALEFAKKAAEEFGVGEDVETKFDSKLIKVELEKLEKKKGKKEKKSKVKEETEEVTA
jgi:CRISPR-associated protein Csb1